MNHHHVAARVRQNKEANPERYCSDKRCLWRLSSGECPKHGGPVAERFDLVGSIMEYESGMMEEAQVLDLFQRLIDSGQVWNLQGSYGRTAEALIEAGLVVRQGGME